MVTRLTTLTTVDVPWRTKQKNRPLIVWNKVPEGSTIFLNSLIYTTIKTTRVSVTEVGALSVAGWAWSAHGRRTLRCQVGVSG